MDRGGSSVAENPTAQWLQQRRKVRHLSRAEKILVPRSLAAADRLPAVKDAKWAKTDIDRFVLARLEKEELKPVAAASKRDLIRRATLDLTGLPATTRRSRRLKKTLPRGVRQSGRPAVWRRRNTASAGAASGWTSHATPKTTTEPSIRRSTRLSPYPNAYNYRDWVIQAFNDDLPFDKFVKAQIAGDLAEPRTRPKVLARDGFSRTGAVVLRQRRI